MQVQTQLFSFQETQVFTGTVTHVWQGDLKVGSYGQMLSGRYWVNPSICFCESSFAEADDAENFLITVWNNHRTVTRQIGENLINRYAA